MLQDKMSFLSFHSPKLMSSMLVQLARDLGEDFYVKHWDRALIMLSQTVRHTEFSVIEVFTVPICAC